MIARISPPLFLWLVLCAPGAADTFTWGSGDGDYGTAANWSPAQVPCNGIVPAAEAVVPAGDSTVTQDVASCTTDGLMLGADTRFRLPTATTYETGVATIGGSIDAVGGDFTAAAAGFDGNLATVSAGFGSQIVIPAPVFTSTGYDNRGIALLTAEHAGTLLDLSMLGTLNAGFDSPPSSGQQDHWVRAFNGGTIDMSQLVSVSGPVDVEDALRFVVSFGGQMNLSSLSSVDSGGRVVFDATASVLELPALSNVANGVFLASVGGAVVASGGPWSYRTSGLNQTDVSILIARDTDSLLDLSAMTHLDAGFDSPDGTGSQVHLVESRQDGTIDLSGLVSVAGPLDEEDVLDFSVVTGGQLDLSSLSQVSGGGQVRFSAGENGVLTLPALDQVANGVFAVVDGGSIVADGPAWTHRATDLEANAVTLMSADGAGSLLDVSGMVSLNAGFDQGVYSANEATIDLSGLMSVTGPADPEGQLGFRVDDGGQLDLSSLSSVTAQGGVAFSAIGDSVLTLPALTTVNTGYLILSALYGSTLTLPSLGDVVNGIFGASINGSVVIGSADWTYDSTALNELNGDVMFASAGSLLDLSGMVSLNAGYDSPAGSGQQVQRVWALDGGVIDLSSLASVTGPVDEEDFYFFQALNYGRIDLSSLGRLGTGSEGGQVGISIVQNGRVNTGALAIGDRGFVVLDDGLGVLQIAGTLTAQPSSLLLALDGAVIEITGDFTFSQTDAANFVMHGGLIRALATAAPQFIEAGSENLGSLGGVPPAGGDNFELGRLEVGSPGTLVEVHLRDAIDNGNGHSLCTSAGEALYLIGVGGMDGLSIDGGSTLVLDGIALYATISGVLTHINPLVSGAMPLAFGGGFIVNGSGQDGDGDGIVDAADNCALVANADQRDTDGDMIGNACDPDIAQPNDGLVNFLDLNTVKDAIFSQPGDAAWNPDADFNGDDRVNFIDLERMKAVFFGAPGPSCAG